MPVPLGMGLNELLYLSFLLQGIIPMDHEP